MNLSAEGRLRRAVGLAFVGGMVGATLVPVQTAQAQQGTKTTELQGVTVTGSLIRRVDKETSNPVTTVTRKAIEQSGVTTMGQLLEQLPMLTGDAFTPQVNNGGNGDGASTISLRGLGSARTLILLDGQRIVSPDVNILPVNMIERVEVLNQGAGTVYGSDAIGGVVNFITRKNFTGTEITGQMGEATDHGDGTKWSASLTNGLSGEKGHLVFGISYDRSGSIRGYNRDVSKFPYSIYYNQVTPLLAASSRIPTGRFFIDPNSINPATGQPWGCKSVTRIEGTDGSTAADFRCRTSHDTYNYQTENFVYVPNDHIHLFATGHEDFTDNLQGYASAFFNHTTGRSQLASEAFDSASLTDPTGKPLNLVISQYSQYNPLGQDITDFTFRAVQSGDRSRRSSEDIYQGTVGLKATLFDRFEWNSSFTYGREDLNFVDYGFLNISQLSQQLGPSKNGVCYTDGTFTTPIPGCVPINVMGTTGTGYGSLSKPQTTIDTDDILTVGSSINGDLFALPLLNAGPIQGAVGVDWVAYHLNDVPDALDQAFQSSENNGAVSSGSYNVKEAYGEFLIPVFRNLPGIYSLNLDAGTRWSQYSNFGDTVNGKYAIEYKPISDLLVRATYADIFRAPTILDLYQGFANSAPSYIDPCNNYTGQPTAQFPHLPAACQNVPTDGSFRQQDTQGSVLVGGNPNLKPEKGYTLDFGTVYSPSWYRPLTVRFDYWNYRIHDAIQPLDLQTALNACATTGDPVYCGNGTIQSPFVRDSHGNVVTGHEGNANIGTLFTDGFDFIVNLDYPKTAFGSFAFELSGTYLDKFQQSVKGASFYSQAGQIGGSSDFIGGGYPRLKFTATLDWSYQDWEVVLRNRFISGESDNGGQDGNGNYFGVDLSGAGYVGNVALYESYGISGTGRCNEGGQSYTATAGGQPAFTYRCWRNTGYVDYQDVQITYKAKKLHTDFTVGVNDVFDEGANIQYTFGPAFNYDASNYDVTGRFVYGRVRVYFK